ncbi:hypothetical protein TL5118_04167 [Thalassovita autumnalis]|jgi:hypothetical protein|uniref:Uncharacterized protein n=2 Tax=Thalassovita autumnalis TaxID=2072972 RepID=A0A0P1FPK8_9RHOB|nr:hypothetical protein TL5118_04167 [Thalassovita autumnalis]CUH71878.1 hypothetical protein TL5120_01670 [Thalassovita autumnalis]
MSLTATPATVKDIDDAASELRGLASQCVDTLFAKAPLPANRLPALPRLLSFDDHSYHSRDSALRRLRDVFDEQPDLPKAAFMSSLIAQAVPANKFALFRDAAVTRWRYHIKREKGPKARDELREFGAALIYYAFVDPRFQMSLLAKMRHYLADRVLLMAEDPAHAIAPETLAILVASQRPKALQETGIDPFFMQITRNLSERENWAQFWDIWLLYEAREQGFAIAEILGADPIEIGAVIVDHDASFDIDVMSPDFKDTLPACAASLLRKSF